MNDETDSVNCLPSRSWLARRLLPEGVEPDPRFTLANERTYLAWIRTALALLAAGIALEAFSASFMGYELRKAISLAFVCLAMIIGSSACLRWLKIERALRARRPLPFPKLVPIVSVIVLLVSLALTLRSAI